MSVRYVHLNGRIVECEAAVVGISDRGLLYGDGMYETIRVRRGQCVRFDRHMERLRHSASVLEMPESVSAFDYGSAVTKLLEANGLSDARVRITITRGASTGDIATSAAAETTTFITANPLPPHDPRPVKVVISSYRRDEASPLCSAKTTNCLPSLLAKSEAARRGADDAIFLNTQGHVAEATTANVFVVKDGRLITPSLDQGCLPGTARSAALGLAQSLGLEPVESVLTREMLVEADEVFLTSAIKLVRSVSEIDGSRVGSGSTAVADRIMELLLAGE